MIDSGARAAIDRSLCDRHPPEAADTPATQQPRLRTNPWQRCCYSHHGVGSAVSTELVTFASPSAAQRGRSPYPTLETPPGPTT